MRSRGKWSAAIAVLSIVAIFISMKMYGNFSSLAQSVLWSSEMPQNERNIVTGNAPAYVSLQAPPIQMDMSQASIELTLEPIEIAPNEPFLVNVQFVDRDRQKGERSGGQFAGSVSFFPPATKGKERKFLIGAPQGTAASKASFELKIELVPASPDIKLERTAVRIVGAKFIN